MTSDCYSSTSHPFQPSPLSPLGHTDVAFTCNLSTGRDGNVRWFQWTDADPVLIRTVELNTRTSFIAGWVALQLPLAPPAPPALLPQPHSCSQLQTEQTDMQTNRHRHRHRHAQTDTQTHRHTDTQTHTDTHAHAHTSGSASRLSLRHHHTLPF